MDNELGVKGWELDVFRRIGFQNVVLSRQPGSLSYGLNHTGGKNRSQLKVAVAIVFARKREATCQTKN